MIVSTNINIDSELKKSAQELYSDLGLDLSTAVNLFLKQSLREQKIPFEIKRESEEEGFFDTLKSFKKSRSIRPLRKWLIQIQIKTAAPCKKRTARCGCLY